MQNNVKRTLLALTVSVILLISLLLVYFLVFYDKETPIEVEDAVNSENIGDRTADSLNAQVLKMGGEDVAGLLDGKVDKETGKGLSTNDFTDAYKSNVDANTQARHSHSNKTVLDGISSSDIANWNAKQASLDFMTDTDVDDLFTAAWNAANS